MTNDIKLDQIQDGYFVEVNKDLTEGRGAQYPKYVCLSQATASRLAKGADVQGTDGRVEICKIFKIGYKWYGPIYLHHPTDDDITVEKIHEAKLDFKRKKELILNKVKALGLSDEEIEILQKDSLGEVVKVDVGDMSPKDAEKMVKELMRKYHKT